MDFQTQPSRWPPSSPTRTPPRGPSPARRTIQTLVAVTAVVLLIGGFYALTQRHSPEPGGQATATTTNTATNTAQTTATSTTTAPVASTAKLAACGFPTSQPAYDLGNGLIVAPSSGLSYPAVQLSEGMPLKPIKVAENPLSSQTFFSQWPLVNPDLHGGGLSLTICNIGQQPVTIQGVKVSVASFTPYSGQLNSWNPCDGVYSRLHGAGGGGCGGGATYDEIVQASFAADSGAGTVVNAVQQNASSQTYGPMPFTLPVRQRASGVSGLALINVKVIPPTAPGTYTFGLGLVAQQSETAFAPAVGPMLLAPVAHKWDGQACEAPNMASQIPAETNPPTYYICPQS